MFSTYGAFIRTSFKLYIQENVSLPHKDDLSKTILPCIKLSPLNNSILSLNESILSLTQQNSQIILYDLTYRTMGEWGKQIYEIKNKTIFRIWLPYWVIYSPSLLSYGHDEPT